MTDRGFVQEVYDWWKETKSNLNEFLRRQVDVKNNHQGRMTFFDFFWIWFRAIGGRDEDQDSNKSGGQNIPTNIQLSPTKDSNIPAELRDVVDHGSSCSDFNPSFLVNFGIIWVTHIGIEQVWECSMYKLQYMPYFSLFSSTIRIYMSPNQWWNIC